MIVDLRGTVPASLAGVAADAYGLVLSQSDLSAIPADIGAAGALRMLDIAHNRLTAVPPSVADLDGARGPLPRRQPLTELPEVVRALRSLVYLGADDNAIAALPEWLGELEELVELRVQHNRLTALPPAIGRLRSLRELHLRGNAIAALPAEIGQLGELRAIDLRANGTPDLPAALLDLPRLDKLDLRWTRTPGFPTSPRRCASAGASSVALDSALCRAGWTGPSKERRETRSARMAMGTLACPQCDAPVALAYPLTPADWMGCPYCFHTGPARDFLVFECAGPPSGRLGDRDVAALKTIS